MRRIEALASRMYVCAHVSKLNGHLCTLSVDPLPLSFKPGFFRFVEDLASIATRFNVNFPMPATLKLPRDEEETFMILRAFA